MKASSFSTNDDSNKARGYYHSHYQATRRYTNPIKYV